MTKKLVTTLVVFIAMLAFAVAPVAQAGTRVAAGDDPVVTGRSIVTLYVAPKLVDCVGVVPQKCMLVREKGEQKFTYFYDTIEGFDYEPGYKYKLRVRKTPIANPPMDASSIKWTLVKQLSKTPAT